MTKKVFSATQPIMKEAEVSFRSKKYAEKYFLSNYCIKSKVGYLISTYCLKSLPNNEKKKSVADMQPKCLITKRPA